MDHPDPIVTLSADRAGKLRAAVSIVEKCLEMWQPFVAAATSQPLHITVTTAWVPPALLQEPPGRIAAHILDVVVPMLVTHAEGHPRPQPAAFWEQPDDREPPPDDPDAGLRLEDVMDGDPLVVARHDGTPAGQESGEEALRQYLCERLEAPGIAGYDDLVLTGTAVGWTLELLPRD
jgi:hypothetical protein